jgi:hypothetical protein
MPPRFSSRIRILIFCPPGSRDRKDTGSRVRIRNTAFSFSNLLRFTSENDMLCGKDSGSRQRIGKAVPVPTFSFIAPSNCRSMPTRMLFSAACLSRSSCRALRSSLGSPPFCRSSLYFSRRFSRSSDRCPFFFSTRKACYQQCFGSGMFITDPIFSIPDPTFFYPGWIPDPHQRV